MPVSWLFLPATVAAVLVTTAAAARAQTPQTPPPTPAQGTLTGGRPYRGVFGSGVDNREQTLTFTGTLGAGYESDYLTTTVESDEPVETGGGLVGLGSATIAYSLGRSRASLGAAVSASTFYYDRDDSQLIHSESASANQALQLGQSTRLTASQHLSNQPFRLNRLFPGNDLSFGAPPTPPLDSFAGDEATIDLGVNVDLTQQLSESMSLSGGYTFQSNAWDDSSRRTFQGGRVALSVAIGRGASLRVGYGNYQSNYHDDETRETRQHNIDVGVDYNGQLSLSRRTTLSFSTGSTAIRDREETHFRVNGRLQLNREIGRSWVASLNYSRDAYYVNQVSEIFFSDSVSFSLGGLVSRRVSFHSGLGMSLGDVGFSAGQTGTHAVYGIAGVTRALTRLTAVGLDYNYYLHSFGADVGIPDGVLRDVDSYSIRAYITLWAPLMSR